MIIFKNAVWFLIVKTIVVGTILVLTVTASAQEFDLLIKNGHVVDPRNGIDEVLDVAIAAGTIRVVAKDIASTRARQVIDARSMYVCPGLIDIHTHVFVGSNPNVFADGVLSLSPDDFTFKSGVTTVVDAGTSGASSFPKFKEQVIDQSKTRILAWLNISNTGMIGSPAQDEIPAMNVDEAVEVARKYSDQIVGIKIGHFEGSDWTPFERAIEAARITSLPLFVECHLPQYSLKDQLARMREGDIITHTFEKVNERMPVVDDDGHVRDFVIAARDKGVLFDLGHGGAGFWFSQAVPAIKGGLPPNTFGTDLHRFSMNAGMKDMVNVMSKFMALGMTRHEVITRATWNAAKAIHRPDLGNLQVGSVADVTILSESKGLFGFVDAGGNRIEGKTKLVTELTLKDGKVMWDLNGISAKAYKH